MKNNFFARKRDDNDYDILYINTGEPVTRLPFEFPLVWPVDSNVSAYADHPDGIILTKDDIKKLGIEIEELDSSINREQTINKAIEEYQKLQSREINPDGTFDDAGRWYPSEKEKCECCAVVRSPSRAWPYSYMIHCRTLKHVCSKYGLNYREVKKAMNKETPKRKVKKQIMYKKVALINNEYYSIYSGEKYEEGKTYREKVQSNHQGGYYAYKTKEEAANAVFPEDSANYDATKIIVKVEMWGRHIKYDNGKYAFTYMKIVGIPL